MANSFDVVNYSVRPNKNVERKLLAESLAALEGTFSISNYRYVGFGSMWFTDFVLFHRILQIADMVSIEGGGDEAVHRARFNRPHTCIRVLGGNSTATLPAALTGEKRTLVWLDYDKGPEAAPIIDDLPIWFRNARSGSVILVSLNATPDRIRIKNDNGKGVKKRVESLKQLIGHVMPTSVTESDLENKKYPATLANIFMDYMKSLPVSLGIGMDFVPMYNFYYRDGAAMITIGGMLCDKKDADALSALKLNGQFFYVHPTDQIRIEVPHLTPKEKMLIDSSIPYKHMDSHETLGLDGIDGDVHLEKPPKMPISQEMLEQYLRYRRYFPYFAEILS